MKIKKYKHYIIAGIILLLISYGWFSFGNNSFNPGNWTDKSRLDMSLVWCTAMFLYYMAGVIKRF